MGEELVNEALRLTRRVFKVDDLAAEGELLWEHSLATAVIMINTLPKAYLLKLAKRSSMSLDIIKAALMIAGLVHDWGKCLKPYQRYLLEGRRHPPLRHEITSFIALTYLTKPGDRASACYLSTVGAVLYHHHGLYDFTRKIIKYLRGGVRAWPNLRGPNREYVEDLHVRLTNLANALSDYLERTGSSEIIKPLDNIEDLINDLINEQSLLKAINKASRIDEHINLMRNIVTPALTSLMIGDNISACISRGRGAESDRILTMTKAAVPAVTLRLDSIINDLRLAELNRYAHALPKIYELLRREGNE